MSSLEFGHVAIRTNGARIDTWGVGPFIMKVGSKTFRFDDSDRFGPTFLKRNGDIYPHSFVGEKSSFWRPHTIWVRQGRRVADDGQTCIWDEPAPMTIQKLGRTWFVVDHGDEDGKVIKLSGEATVALRSRP